MGRFTEKGTLFLCLLRNFFFFSQGKTALHILFGKNIAANLVSDFLISFKLVLYAVSFRFRSDSRVVPCQKKMGKAAERIGRERKRYFISLFAKSVFYISLFICIGFSDVGLADVGKSNIG